MSARNAVGRHRRSSPANAGRRPSGPSRAAADQPYHLGGVRSVVRGGGERLLRRTRESRSSWSTSTTAAPRPTRWSTVRSMPRRSASTPPSPVSNPMVSLSFACWCSTTTAPAPAAAATGIVANKDIQIDRRSQGQDGRLSRASSAAILSQRPAQRGRSERSRHRARDPAGSGCRRGLHAGRSRRGGDLGAMVDPGQEYRHMATCWPTARTTPACWSTACSRRSTCFESARPSFKPWLAPGGRAWRTSRPIRKRRSRSWPAGSAAGSMTRPFSPRP